MQHPDTEVNVPTIHLQAAAGGVGGSWYVLMEGLARPEHCPPPEPGPLHPGATRYFRVKGLTPQNAATTSTTTS
jgi:hypothetical protein